MARRLDIERQKRLTPKRVEKTLKEIESIGYSPKVEFSGESPKIVFEFKGCVITFWPYSGWSSGKTIKDGRGLKNLIDQIKK